MQDTKELLSIWRNPGVYWVYEEIENPVSSSKLGIYLKMNYCYFSDFYLYGESKASLELQSGLTQAHSQSYIHVHLKKDKLLIKFGVCFSHILQLGLSTLFTNLFLVGFLALSPSCLSALFMVGLCFPVSDFHVFAPFV